MSDTYSMARADVFVTAFFVVRNSTSGEVVYAPPEVLDLLAGRDGSPGVALRVAENPSTPISTLERLARCDSSELADAVAQTPSTPPAVLELLAGSRRWRTRLRAARRRDTPRNTLEHLSGSDPDLDVRAAAAMTLSAVLQPRPRAA